MTKKLEYQMELSFQVYNKYFDGVLDSSYDSGIHKGIVNGRRAFFKVDYEKIIISYEGSNECELFYFYPGETNKLLGHYYITEDKAKTMEVATSIVSERENGGVSLETYKTAYERNLNRYFDNQLSHTALPKPLSFEDVYTDDIIGKDAFEIDGMITALPGIYNTSFEGDVALEADHLLSLDEIIKRESTFLSGRDNVRYRN